MVTAPPLSQSLETCRGLLGRSHLGLYSFKARAHLLTALRSVHVSSRRSEARLMFPRTRTEEVLRHQDGKKAENRLLHSKPDLMRGCPTLRARCFIAPSSLASANCHYAFYLAALCSRTTGG